MGRGTGGGPGGRGGDRAAAAWCVLSARTLVAHARGSRAAVWRQAVSYNARDRYAHVRRMCGCARDTGRAVLRCPSRLSQRLCSHTCVHCILRTRSYNCSRMFKPSANHSPKFVLDQRVYPLSTASKRCLLCEPTTAHSSPGSAICNHTSHSAIHADRSDWLTCSTVPSTYGSILAAPVLGCKERQHVAPEPAHLHFAGCDSLSPSVLLHNEILVLYSNFSNTFSNLDPEFKFLRYSSCVSINV